MRRDLKIKCTKTCGEFKIDENGCINWQWPKCPKCGSRAEVIHPDGYYDDSPPRVGGWPGKNASRHRHAGKW